MTTIKKLGIWMDHSSAHVMEYNDDIKTNIVRSGATHADREKTLQKGESMMHNREQQRQAAYYRTLGESIKNYDHVLLFGPTDARVELMNILKADSRFSKIKIETRQADKMTENQEHAFVKEYFTTSRKE